MAFYTGGLPIFEPQDMNGGYGNFGGGFGGNSIGKGILIFRKYTSIFLNLI